ncbi:UNKNOWN [Stylonychia lemnae]|uniref:Uncharacterized protein n=1 Tax=Stylonychia lemnae TaxID=5949 RepID=A0A077ZY65_STYLE|nr:UNKNOWN [Stylonychia lemnae]|eukprot:CDW74577.1 UNKNOWN [Stylonychia lemnae]
MKLKLILVWIVVILLPQTQQAAYEVAAFNDYCIKCTYFNYVHCYLNNKCFSENPGFCLSVRSNIIDCSTTSDTPITISITDSLVGTYKGRTEWVSGETWVMYQFQNQLSSGIPGRLRISYSGTNLKFYKAPSLALATNANLVRVGITGELTVSTGTTYYLLVVNTENLRETFYMEYQNGFYFKAMPIIFISSVVILFSQILF